MRTASRRYAIVLLLAMGLSPAFAAAEPGPRGPSIAVSTDGFAACPWVAMCANGDFEVVWNNNYSDSHPIPQGIFARHFDRQGRPTQAKEIRLDSPRNVQASDVRIIALPGAGYFVVWFEYRGGSRLATVGRFLDTAGHPRSPALLLNRYASPLAVVLVSDSLLVAWRQGSEGSLWARRFDLAGHALGKAMLLTNHKHLGVAGLAPLADSFVAVWERWTGTVWAVETQRFSLAGKPLGAALRVNENPPGGQFWVQVASDGNGCFAVAWTERKPRSDPQTGRQVFDDEPRVRFFDAGGARGPETNPSQLRTGNENAWGLAMDRDGLTLVTWVYRNSTSVDVAGRFVDSNGQPVGPAFPISQNLAGAEHWPALCPAVATGGEDDAWVAAWLKQGTGIFARRLALEAEPAAEN